MVIVHPWSLLFTVLRGYLQLFAIPAMIGSLHEPSSGNGRPQELRMRKLDGGLSIHWFLQFFNGLLKHQVDMLVLVTGDADFVPPMKFARRESVQFVLVALGHDVHQDLLEHADFSISLP